MIKRLLIIIFFFNTFNANALIKVDITRGNLNPLPIAISSLSVDKTSLTEFKKVLKIDEVGLEIAKVVENNLRKSGLFFKNTVIKNLLISQHN